MVKKKQALYIERNMLTTLEYLYSLKYKTLFFTKYDKKT